MKDSPCTKTAYRHYCCVCSNYRGKVVDGKIISLHRFPTDKLLQSTWLKRIKLVSPAFQLNLKNDRICSAHFEDGEYVKGKNGNNVPSKFVLSDGRHKTFAAATAYHSFTPTELDSFPVDISCRDEVECAEDFSSFNTSLICTVDMSNEQTSTKLHDYCGRTEDTLLTVLNKNEQTYFSCENVATQTSEMFTCTCVKPSMNTVSTQTDEHDNNRDKITTSVGIQCNRPELTFEDIQNSDEMCMFYTGIPNADTFYLLFNEMSDAEQHTHRAGNGDNPGRPRTLRLIDEFFLVLMRLRLGLLLRDLAQRFHISKSTCSNITSQWISYLCVKLAFLTAWPSRKTIHETLPNKFKRKYPKCRVIIDCTEIYTETPQSLANKSLMYSHYKSHMTYKALLGISPSGLITFSSDLWAGSISDKQLTKNCGILDLCESGDAIMADKGFLISDLTTPRGIRLIIPPMKYQRFNRKQVEETRRIANLRIDVERAMERVKNFRILQGVMPITLSRQATKIWKLCVCLSNLLPPLVHDED